jgi:RNA polymerase sigma-70 factor (ECF subfamily)
MLRSRTSRREEPLDSERVEPRPDPEQEALLADAVGPALLVVLDTLSPAERLAFVLHDLFAVPFDELGTILDRSPEAARQLASRARRRVRGATAPADPARQRQIVDAFLAASRDGDFDSLLALLDPDVVVRADAAAVATGAAPEVRGAREVAETFVGRARAAQTALIDGLAGLVWSRGGRPQVVFDITVDGDRITAIDLIADRDRLDAMEVVAVDS